MAGYKQTVIDDGAAAFWTFDGDKYDPVTRNLLADPLTILDEIDNQNPGILHVQSVLGPHGYRLGMPGLVDLERGDQHSICFGYYGKQPSHPDKGWAKAFIEVPHSSTFMFPRYGTFAVEFMMKKEWESSLRDDYSYSIAYDEPILRKADVIEIRFYHTLSTSNPDHVRFTFPDGLYVRVYWEDYYDKNCHVVAQWDAKHTEEGVYTGEGRVYIDGRLVGSVSKTYYDTPPNTNRNSPWEIGGWFDTPDAYWNDRNTSPLHLDQIAVYDATLTDDQIANHYKKIYEYDTMIMNDGASDYFPMDEENNTLDWTIKNKVRKSYTGTYIGDTKTIERGYSGPDNLPLSKAPYFTGQSTAEFLYRPAGATRPWINTAKDYAIEFWFNTMTAKRGVLLAMQQEQMPYHGVQITINWANGVDALGVIEFSENLNDTVTSLAANDANEPYRFNDGRWHHIVVQRQGTTLSLWIDGVLHGQKDNVAAKATGETGAMYLMGSKPGYLNTNGQICKFAIYTRALQPQQIKIRNMYAIIYRIRGMVTLQGIPTRATIRVYLNRTGELVKELESDPLTGEYAMSLLNNSKIDLMVFNKNDSTVRYRAYGPITPSEYSDTPILI